MPLYIISLLNQHKVLCGIRYVEETLHIPDINTTLEKYYTELLLTDYKVRVDIVWTSLDIKTVLYPALDIDQHMDPLYSNYLEMLLDKHKFIKCSIPFLKYETYLTYLKSLILFQDSNIPEVTESEDLRSDFYKTFVFGSQRIRIHDKSLALLPDVFIPEVDTIEKYTLPSLESYYIGVKEDSIPTNGVTDIQVIPQQPQQPLVSTTNEWIEKLYARPAWVKCLEEEKLPSSFVTLEEIDKIWYTSERKALLTTILSTTDTLKSNNEDYKNICVNHNILTFSNYLLTIFKQACVRPCKKATDPIPRTQLRRNDFFLQEEGCDKEYLENEFIYFVLYTYKKVFIEQTITDPLVNVYTSIRKKNLVECIDTCRRVFQEWYTTLPDTTKLSLKIYNGKYKQAYYDLENTLVKNMKKNKNNKTLYEYILNQYSIHSILNAMMLASDPEIREQLLLHNKKEFVTLLCVLFCINKVTITKMNPLLASTDVYTHFLQYVQTHKYISEETVISQTLFSLIMKSLQFNSKRTSAGIHYTNIEIETESSIKKDAWDAYYCLNTQTYFSLEPVSWEDAFRKTKHTKNDALVNNDDDNNDNNNDDDDDKTIAVPVELPPYDLTLLAQYIADKKATATATTEGLNETRLVNILSDILNPITIPLTTVSPQNTVVQPENTVVQPENK